ncbi:MAG: Asp-tRNA(Asn)/Glu-tRNA(Gln) amidotransferase subunit GatC [Rickettsiaceae bacterium]|nr:Asp-tRNA(Asn)/Glu-tRNA(Gln) amidotransferase subunit GatC [Rickettsiaceae bacterium]
MLLEKEEIDRIAKLMKLRITEKQAITFQESVSSIIKMIEPLRKLNTNNVKPLSSVLDAGIRLRADESIEQDSREAFATNAPNKNNQNFGNFKYFVVPKVVE